MSIAFVSAEPVTGISFLMTGCLPVLYLIDLTSRLFCLSWLAGRVAAYCLVINERKTYWRSGFATGQSVIGLLMLILQPAWHFVEKPVPAGIWQY